jgi:hypothetical protein
LNNMQSGEFRIVLEVLPSEFIISREICGIAE